MTAIISTNSMVMILIIESMMIAIISKAPQNVRKYPPTQKKIKKMDITFLYLEKTPQAS